VSCSQADPRPAEVGTKEQAAAKPEPLNSGISRYEQTDHHRLGWLLERVGWAMMAVVVLAAGVGLFGNGLFSAAEAATGDGKLAARYQRYWRARLPGELEIRWPADAGETTIWIEDAYLDNFEIGGVSPTPAAVAIGAERSFYTFKVQEPNMMVRVSFRLEPKRGGSFKGRIGRADGGELTIEQFVFP
jgi:hypothetical protein